MTTPQGICESFDAARRAIGVPAQVHEQAPAPGGRGAFHNDAAAARAVPLFS